MRGDVAGQYHGVHVSGGVAQLVEEGEPLMLGEDLKVEVAQDLEAHADRPCCCSRWWPEKGRGWGRRL